ncbi:MAG: mannose-1-phosphate guanylyltransferase [Planctomycetota bacterium]|jgi:mannose-1-phosphate guanylyltransferase
MKFVIRAGGIGTRLWPYSRKSRPKQFHAMAGRDTMIQGAVERIAAISAREDVYVSTGQEMAGLVREQLPQISAEQVIIEPALRNTGPAVGLECALLEARFPGCAVASLGSDHYIGKGEVFCQLLQAAEAALEQYPDYLFMLGVKPTRAETGYGYIRRGSVLQEFDGVPVYSVDAFAEKPDAVRAQQYLDSGDYLWNSNMFVWKAATVLELFARYEPEMYEILARIGASVGSENEAETIALEYPKLQAVAIDNAIIERAEKVATLEADIDWGDIGSWAALTDVLAADGEGNLLSGDIVSIDARNTTVYGHKDKLIALIGVEDLVIVDTEDALLVCRKGDAQRVKEILERLDGAEKYGRYT